MTTTEQLPIFVYGTLRPGCGASSFWHHLADGDYDGECFVVGFRLVTQGPFPYAIRQRTYDKPTVGCLVRPRPQHYDSLLRELDRYEGYPDLYDRVIVGVDTPSGDIERAWIYTPSDQRRHERMTPVDWNDWSLHKFGAVSS